MVDDFRFDHEALRIEHKHQRLVIPRKIAQMATVQDAHVLRRNKEIIELEHSMPGDNRDASFKADTNSKGAVRNEYKHLLNTQTKKLGRVLCIKRDRP